MKNNPIIIFFLSLFIISAGFLIFLFSSENNLTTTTSTTTTTTPTTTTTTPTTTTTQVVYTGPYSEYEGFEGENQLLLNESIRDLPTTLLNVVLQKVKFINGCHVYGESLSNRCPYGVWDSKGTFPDGSAGSAWSNSIWISNRAFDSKVYFDVLLHETAHAYSYLTRNCNTESNNSYRLEVQNYFGGEENYADAVVLYFGGEYIKYRTETILSDDEREFLKKYFNTCSS